MIKYLVIVNDAAHDGWVEEVNMSDIWSSSNSDGWTYQSITGSHGRVLDDFEQKRDATDCLESYLKCDAVETGRYCFTHNPGGQ